MKKILLSLLAIFFPWIVILLEGKFISAMACLALQLTFVGWIPASIWAFKAAKRVELQENNVNITEPPTETQAEMPDSSENQQQQQVKNADLAEKMVEKVTTTPDEPAQTEKNAPPETTAKPETTTSKEEQAERPPKETK